MRKLAGQKPGEESFTEQLVHSLFLDGEDPWEEWVYELMHIGFGVLVLVTLVLVPPRFRRAGAAPAHDAIATGGQTPQPGPNGNGVATVPTQPVPEPAPEATAS